jgi:hypothetical protein
MGATYIGTEPGAVRINDRPILPNDTIAGPPDVVADLLKRADFKPSGDEPQDATDKEIE